jgi:hypothetical protein
MSNDPIDKLNVLRPADTSAPPVAPAYGGGQASAEQSGSGLGHNPDGPALPSVTPAGRVLVRRDVFWNNVVRDILMAMASAAAASSGRLKPTVSGAQSSVNPVDELFDGRVGLMTTLGQRIPIADVYPVFSCSSIVPGTDRSLSSDVQCTIFRILTPSGESYTLPLSQITGVHSLSEDLIAQLEQASAQEDQTDTEHISKAPFGFGAYTSLARAERAAREKDSENSENGSE